MTTKEIPPGKQINLPSERGRKLGAHMARLCDDAESRKMLTRPRCGTCAFRLGTFPNGCEATLMDAMKCAMEQRRFLCHENKHGQTNCAGWMAMRFQKPLTAPWPWSNND